MNIGMLWFDNEHKKTLAERIAAAAGYYRGKYGAAPTTCILNPQTSPQERQSAAQATGMSIRTQKAILPDHFWLGVEPRQENLL